jgi:ketosteroid isomerase-like protein
MKRTVLLQLGIGVLAAALLAGCASLGKGPSDQEQIQSALAAWKDALEAKNVDNLMALYSENFASDRQNKEGVRRFVQGAIDQGYLDKPVIVVEDATITVEGDKATARPVSLSSPEGSIYLYLEFTKEEGKWLITGSGEA